MRSTVCSRPLTVAVTFVVSSSALAAGPAALVWDANPASPGVQDGPGTWDTVAPNFFDSATGVNYAYDNAGHDVTFLNGSAGGLVTIGVGGVTAHSLNFGNLQGSIYTLGAARSPALTLVNNGVTDPGISFDTFGAAIIAAPIASSAKTITKTGAGQLTLTGSNTYTGTLRINGGRVIADTPATLPGFADGRVAVGAGSTLWVRMSDAGWQAADIAALSAANSFQTDSNFVLEVASGDRAYAGRLPAATRFSKLGTGGLTLTAAQPAFDAVTLVGHLGLSGTASLPANAINFYANSTLSVGAGLTQSLGQLNSNVYGTTTFVVNGAGSATAGAAFELPSPSTTYDLSGLSSFTYAQQTKSLAVNAANSTLKFAVTTTVTATALNVGTANANWDLAAYTNSLTLGAATTLNVDAVQIGTYHASGTVSAPAGTGSLVVRARNGVDRVGSVAIGYNDGSYTLQTAVFDAGGLTLDARIGTMTLARGVNGWGNVSGRFAMSAGTLDATAITIATAASSYSPPNGTGTTTGRFEQNGGTVRVGTLTMGVYNVYAYAGAYQEFATYTLGTPSTSATLAAGSITGGFAPSDTSVYGARTLNFNNGRITTPDSSTDLTITGSPPAAGQTSRLLNVVLAASGLHAITAPAGHFIRLTDTAPVGGSGGLTIDGPGTVFLNAANTYTGGTVVTAGTLRALKPAQAMLLTGNGTDVRGGRAIFNYTAAADNPASVIRALLKSAYAGGFTTGVLRSTTADATRGLGYADSGTAVTVMPTLYGDADLDGGVSINDFNTLAGNFGQATGKVWVDGDFDYDGGVSINDFNLLAANFGKTAGVAADFSGLLAFAAAHNDLATFVAVTGVPEPTGFALLAFSAVVGLRRRCPS